MKIQASIYNILLTRLLPIILLSCLFVPMVIQFYRDLQNHFNIVILFALIGLGLFILLIVWSMLDVLAKRKEGILILTDKGFYCPYLLDASTLICWSDVMGIEFDHVDYRGIKTPYVVIYLSDMVHLEKKTTVFDSWNNYFEKYSHYKTLVISSRSMSDYTLTDMCDILRSYWNKKNVAHDIQLHDLNKKTSVAYTTYFSVLIFLLMYIVFTTTTWILMTTLFSNGYWLRLLQISLVVGIVTLWLFEINGYISKLSALAFKPLAIEFDKDGIYQLNNTHFEYPILWKNVIAVELKRKQRGRYSVPYLFVMIQGQNEKVHTAQIRNDLHDTSVYELYEVMTNYLEAGSNSPS